MKSVLMWVVIVACGALVLAQEGPGEADRPGLPASAMPPILREVGFDQNLNQRVPLDLQFTNEDGRIVPLGQYFGARPVVLALVYYGCPMLCMQTLKSLASTVAVLTQQPGREFEIVAVSFDPKEKPELARSKKASILERSGGSASAAGWHFLTGSVASIDGLTRSVGFRYVWDESAQQYAHPTGLVVLTPGGRVARYLFGIDYGPRDLRLAVLDAAADRISSPIDRLLLYCYHYDLSTGRYSLAIMRVVRVAGAMTVLSLGALIVVLTRRERAGVR